MGIVEFDLKKLTLMRLMNLNKNKENIEKNSENLYRIVQNYLESLNVNPKFVDKPAIIERVKNIIFNNLLLNENVEFKSNGIVVKNDEKQNKKIFSVLENGSIIFYQENKKEKLVVSFDEMNEGLACRFLEYSKGEILKSEKRVIIDDYGFDKKFYEITDELSIDNINEKLREKFKHIITYIDGNSVTAFTDWGNHSITPLLDNKFLCAKKSKKIASEELYEENRFQKIDLKDKNNWLAAFPIDIPEMDDISIDKVKNSYNYYTSKYSLAKAWFINRYGKEFLINKNIISEEEQFQEETLIEKISQANQEEVILNFKKSNTNFSENELIDIINSMYSQCMYGKAIAFFDILTDNQKIEFLNSYDNYDKDFISSCICRIESDSKKREQYSELFEQFSLDNKIAIISSFSEEQNKVELYDDIIEEIIAHDTDLGEELERSEELDQSEENEEEYIDSEKAYLSEAVIDSLKDVENIKEFILKLSDFPIIKYENLKNMSKEDIDYLIENLEGYLDIEENVAFLKTGYIEDEYILELLKNNWKDGLEISSNESIEVGEDLAYSFKVFALLKVNDEAKKLEFLDDNIEEFSFEEISLLLEDVEDSYKMLSLAKKYNLPSDYIYGLVTLCEDDIKVNFLDCQKEIEKDNFIRVASSIQDVSKAMEFVIKTDKTDIITKLETINELYVELATEDEVSELSEKKFRFLMENNLEISKKIEDKEAAEVFELYVSEFWNDDKKMEIIEKTFENVSENIIEDDCK